MNAPFVINGRSMNENMLSATLRGIISSNHFGSGLSIHYQPFVRMSDGAITGAEALVRYDPPQGKITADVFVPIIEKMGLIVPLSKMVLDQVAHDLAHVLPSTLSVSVNIDATHFAHDLVNDIFSPFERYGVNLNRLEIEITESATMDNEIALPLLAEIRAAGGRIFIDDFGTGHNSLLRLSDCQYDAIKIDRHFVNRMAKSPRDRNIVLGITGLAEEIGVKVIAEGVENIATLNMLKWMNVHGWQGYLCSQAIPVAELAKMLKGPPRHPEWASIICIY